jgi:hypothetical protein
MAATNSGGACATTRGYAITQMIVDAENTRAHAMRVVSARVQQHAHATTHRRQRHTRVRRLACANVIINASHHALQTSYLPLTRRVCNSFSNIAIE